MILGQLFSFSTVLKICFEKVLENKPAENHFSGVKLIHKIACLSLYVRVCLTWYNISLVYSYLRPGLISIQQDVMAYQFLLYKMLGIFYITLSTTALMVPM